MTRAECLQTYRVIKKWLKDNIDLSKYSAKIYLGGSVAKETSVDYQEIDVFITSNAPEKLFENLKVLNRLIKGDVQIKKSITNYVTFVYNNISVDLVPVTHDVNNSSYYSLKHVPFIKKHLRYPSEVVKFKNWLKDRLLYNTEVTLVDNNTFKVEKAVSGYISELIMVKFITLDNLKKIPTDVYEYLRNIRDPIAPHRELYASVSKENLQRFYFYLKNWDLHPPFNLLHSNDYTILKLSKQNYRAKKIYDIKKVFNRSNRFFETIWSLDKVYIIYINEIEYIKMSTPINPYMDISALIKTSYFDFKGQNTFVNKIVKIDLNLLHSSYGIAKQSIEYSKICQLLSLLWPTRVDKIC